MILIVGCGFLGQYVLKELLQKTDETILCTYRAEKPKLKFNIDDKRVRFAKCDVTSKVDLQALGVLCGGEKVTVFYFAAYHNIDAVYHHPNEAKKVNVDALKNFCATVKNMDALYFASTDCVYGESKPEHELFKETDKCNPINEYGKQKLEAESLVLKAGFNVFRFSLLYGASLSEKQNFYDKTFLHLKRGESVEMITGLSRNAITYKKAAKIIVKLVLEREDIPQIMNIAGDKLLTKYELGLRIAADAGAAPELIKPISKTEGQKFFAEKRASVIALDNALLNSNLSAYGG